MNSFEEFLKAQNKSLFIHQYKCKCSKKYWWGSNSNNICKRCKKVNVHLDLKKMIGIGWFECKCGRKYAGFSRGDVSSKCHICQDENYPSFIVPGDDAKKDEKSQKSHYCAMCHGGYNCPIVDQIRRSSK